MSHKKGTISVNTTDIFPIIKKWLYSEHDIFLRELVSNACDAITKRNTLARTNGAEATTGKVDVIIDKKAKTITIKDNGIGMTDAEIEKYIAQLAFSGAEEFVQKMKDMGPEAKDEIIGKFGLGFYSAFMVAEKVVINSLSMNEGAKATQWSCLGDTEYEFSDSNKTEVGTEITLYINEESKDFLESYKTRSTLTNYCDFLPYTIELIDLNENQRIEDENAKATKEEDKKPIPVDIINETKPLWKKDPSTIKDEEYISFFKKMFPMEGEPLFWIHLNVDHPFTLQGILFFPKVNPTKPVQERNIRLYCKQVFVSDNVKNIIPDFLGLLRGAIDSADIPLNVSRSALQGDPNISKISNYIIKKVGEALKKLFKNDREKYEKVWDDISLFVKYGTVSDTKFDDLMRPYLLFKNTENKLVTIEEYLAAHPEKFAEKLKNKIITFELEASDESLRKELIANGVQAVSMDNYIDPHLTQHLQMHKKNDMELNFSTVDEIIEELLETENTTDEDIKIKELFQDVLVSKDDKDKTLEIEIKNFKDAKTLAYFKFDAQMKRFQQMTKMMGNSNFDMPMKKTLILNPSHALIKNAFKIYEKGTNQDLAKKICHHVQDLATLSSEGLKAEEKEKFVLRSQELMGELSNLAI
jgi:molecular chaperone HtpG